MFIGILFIKNTRPVQCYQTGIGARFGGLASGLTIKHFFSNTSGLEGIWDAGHKSLMVEGLSEKNRQHFLPNCGSYFYNDHRLYTSSIAGGTKEISVMEYTYNEVAVNATPDFKPFVDFFNGSTVYFDGGLNLHYTV